MPFQSEVTPFVGDDDLADFMLDVFADFAVNTMGWVNSAPSLGSHPTYEFWFHRGTGGAPEPPFAFYRTDGNGHMHIFSGTGIDTGEEIYDQPGNPMNCPQNVSFGVGSSVQNLRCLFLNSLVGPFQAYWLFGPTDGSYIHCVIKVAERQYRHFHVGLLKPLHSDLSDDAFYVTGHFWNLLAPGNVTSRSSPPAQNEHDPYSHYHRVPFGHSRDMNESIGPFPQFRGQWLYMPGMNDGLGAGGSNIDWYLCAEHNSINANELWNAAPLQKQVGDVNAANDAVTFGVANITGWADSLGTILYMCDRTFSSNAVPLIPIYCGATVNFAGAARMGVVAQIPDVFRVNMRFLSPEQEITVGSDTYVVFPLINKDNQNVLDGEGYSAYEGLAYRKITGAVV